MSSLIITLTIFNVFLIVIENSYKDQELKDFQKELVKGWRTFKNYSIPVVIKKCAVYYSNLFDIIYGNKLVSTKLFIRSIISSLIAVLSTYIFFSITDDNISSIFSSNIGNGVFFTSLLFLLGINLVADILSLGETKFIFQKLQNWNLRGILLLLVLDIVVSSLIYISVFLSFRSFVDVDSEFLFLQLDRSEEEAELKNLSYKEQALIVQWSAYDLKEDSIITRQNPEEYRSSIFGKLLSQQMPEVIRLRNAKDSISHEISAIQNKKKYIEYGIFNDISKVRILIIAITFLSTFFTSAIFYFFLGSSIALSFLHRNRNVIERFINWFENQDKPLSKISAIVSAIIVLIKVL